MGRRSNNYKEFMKTIKRLYDNADNIAKDAAEHICDAVEKDLNDKFKEAIRYNFYDDYTPMFYKRRRTLYKAYKIFNDGKSIKYKLSPEYMPDVHRVSNDYIFKYMFEKGYHGGARHYWEDEDGIRQKMAYRTPTPEAIASGTSNGTPYRKWSKLPVEQSYSPAEGVYEAFTKYRDSKEFKNRIKQGIEFAFWKYDIT